MTADTVARVNNRIDTLGSVSIAKLHDQWRRTFKVDPPMWPPDLLRRSIANRWQEGVVGGLSSEVAETIDRLVAKRLKPSSGAASRGTRYIRHWRGQEYRVEADADGFAYDGKRYRSLTAVAKAITGQHMSGPSFFGAKRAG